MLRGVSGWGGSDVSSIAYGYNYSSLSIFSHASSLSDKATRARSYMVWLRSSFSSPLQLVVRVLVAFPLVLRSTRTSRSTSKRQGRDRGGEKEDFIQWTSFFFFCHSFFISFKKKRKMKQKYFLLKKEKKNTLSFCLFLTTEIFFENKNLKKSAK